ncbi:MAG: dicarboxylate/amino acid:cation symporter [Ginsengibacter sp.]
MRHTWKMLLALLVAITLGEIASTNTVTGLITLANYIEPIGLLWIGFLKMVIIPLLISLVVISVASHGKGKQTSPLLRRTLLVFMSIYMIMLLAAFIIVPLLLQLLPSSLSLVSVHTDAAVVANAKPLSFTDQLLSWVPQNPFKSASDGAILPVVIFSLLFGLGLNHAEEEQRNAVINFFQAVSSAMLKIVDWVLYFAPIGIFCIVFHLATRVQIAGTLGFYLLIHLVMHLVCLLLLYPLATVFGKVPFKTFVRACFQPQLIALGTQSSIATLPAMIIASERKLMLPHRLTSVVLPMAVSFLKAGTVITNVIYVLYTARMYHIEVTGWQWVTLFVVSFAAAVGAAGIPGSAASLAPLFTLFTAMSLPFQGIPILFAMDTIPDMMDTAVNVTGHMAATAIVAKGHQDVEDKQAIRDEVSQVNTHVQPTLVEVIK